MYVHRMPVYIQNQDSFIAACTKQNKINEKKCDFSKSYLLVDDGAC